MKVRMTFEIEVANESEAREWRDKVGVAMHRLDGVASPDDYWYEFIADEGAEE
jgi:hypothetical protein